MDGNEVDAEKVTGEPSGGTVAMLAKQVEQQPLLTEGNLKSRRFLDHEILSRFLSYTLWVFIAVCLGFVSAYQFWISRMTRLLASRMKSLLLPSDWCWILGAGVFLPFIFVMAVNRLTPLGGRQFGVNGMDCLLPTVHFVGLLILWLVMPLMVVRWRLSERAGIFSFPKTTGVGWLVVLCATAFVPAIGWVVVSGISEDFIQLWRDDFAGQKMSLKSMLTVSTVMLLWVIALGWVLWQAASAMFGRPHNLIWRATSSLVLVRVYVVVLLLLAFASMGFRAAEQFWFSRDLLGKADVRKPGWSNFEYEVALQMRKELREILGYSID